jgi:hypothetical protein
MEPCFDLLKHMVGTAKSIEGDAGWLFLANDTNKQFAQQFGFWCWDETAI